MSYNGTIQDSAPCQDCHKTLMELGIKRLVYSNGLGDFTSCKMTDYISKSASLGRRYIESDFTLGKKSEKQKEQQEQKKQNKK